MDTGMPFLHPMGPDALRRKSGCEETSKQPQENPAAMEEPMPQEPSFAWAPQERTDPAYLASLHEEDDWPEEGEDAMPTDRMPLPVCVPTLPPLYEKKRKSRAWLAVMAAAPAGFAIGYGAYWLSNHLPRL